MTLREIWADYFGHTVLLSWFWVPFVVLCRAMPLKFVTDRWWPIMGHDRDYL